MIDFENDANPFEERRESIAPWRALAAIDISESPKLIQRAETFYKLGFRAKDSAHLSCAVEANCDVFLTTDKGILKKSHLISELAIINPVDYDFNNDDD
jgi:predicted nucleic acid-binding protein